MKTMVRCKVMLTSASIGLALTLAGEAFAASSPNVKPIFDEYSKTGAIDACHHDVVSLRLSREKVPPQLQGPVADFDQQVQIAINTHSQGRCRPGESTAAATGEQPTADAGAPPPPPAAAATPQAA